MTSKVHLCIHLYISHRIEVDESGSFPTRNDARRRVDQCGQPSGCHYALERAVSAAVKHLLQSLLGPGPTGIRGGGECTYEG